MTLKDATFHNIPISDFINAPIEQDPLQELAESINTLQEISTGVDISGAAGSGHNHDPDGDGGPYVPLISMHRIGMTIEPFMQYPHTDLRIAPITQCDTRHDTGRVPHDNPIWKQWRYAIDDKYVFAAGSGFTYLSGPSTVMPVLTLDNTIWTTNPTVAPYYNNLFPFSRVSWISIAVEGSDVSGRYYNKYQQIPINRWALVNPGSDPTICDNGVQLMDPITGTDADNIRAETSNVWLCFYEINTTPNNIQVYVPDDCKESKIALRVAPCVERDFPDTYIYNPIETSYVMGDMSFTLDDGVTSVTSRATRLSPVSTRTPEWITMTAEIPAALQGGWAELTIDVDWTDDKYNDGDFLWLHYNNDDPGIYMSFYRVNNG